MLKNFCDKNCKLLFVFLFCVALASLAFGYYVEYVLGFTPCQLCLYQRVPYYVVIGISIVRWMRPQWDKLLCILLIINFAISFSLATYHVGVENGIFEVSGACKIQVLDLNPNLSVQEIKKIIYSAPKVSCDMPSFKLFNISMAVINSLWSTFLLLLTVLVTFLRFKYAKTNIFKKRSQ